MDEVERTAAAAGREAEAEAEAPQTQAQTPMQTWVQVQVQRLSGADADAYEWPYSRVQTPRGMRDLLPAQVTRRRALEAKLVEVFAQAGYEEVETPLLEYADVVAAGDLQEGELVSPSGRLSADFDVYRLFDPEGEALVLRADMTTPIARLAATRLASWPRPLRLCYVADVFRFGEVHAGRLRQFRQVGAERIGVGEAAAGLPASADAEMVALAAQVLAAAGLRRFRIDIGHVGLVRALVEAGGWRLHHRRALHRALMERNQVALGAVLAQAQAQDQAEGKPIPGAQAAARTLLVQLPRWFGVTTIPAAAAEALASLPLPTVRQALDELGALLSAVRAAGVGDDRIGVDLGLVRDLGYYTGPVLEGFSPDLALPLLSGGRYDHLVEQFGPRPEPATGFAIGLDRLELALAQQ